MDDRQSSRQMVGTLVFMLTGPILWALEFTMIYGTQSSLCAFEAIPTNGVGGLVISISVLLLLLVILAVWRPFPLFVLLVGAQPPDSQKGFLWAVMQGLGALSALTMLYFILAANLLLACGQLR